MTTEEEKEYFLREVANIINKCSFEKISDTPDFILAESIWYHFIAMNEIINKRKNWYGKP